MIYFDSDMSKSTNTVAHFDWQTVIYIYACGKCRTQFMLPMEKSVTFTGACANEMINRSFVYKAKEGRYVRIENIQWPSIIFPVDFLSLRTWYSVCNYIFLTNFLDQK
jgi:hypothetical protein